MIYSVTKENELVWAQLCRELWPNYTVEELLEESETGRAGQGFLIYEADFPAGFINLSIRHDYVEGTHSSPVAYVEGIYVKNEFRQKGVAKRLMEFAKTWALEKGCTELASDCEVENSLSREFHNRIGFKEAGTIVCFTMDLK